MHRRVLNGRGRRSMVVVVALLGLLVAVAGGIQHASARPDRRRRASGDQPLPPRPADPIVVGSTLSLTGCFAATGIIHKAAGETFVRWVNANGGAARPSGSSGGFSTTSPIPPR